MELFIIVEVHSILNSCIYPIQLVSAAAARHSCVFRENTLKKHIHSGDFKSNTSMKIINILILYNINYISILHYFYIIFLFRLLLTFYYIRSLIFIFCNHYCYVINTVLLPLLLPYNFITINAYFIKFYLTYFGCDIVWH